MSREKMIPPQPPTDETPWERFERFAKKIITTPQSVRAKPKRSQKPKGRH